MKIFEDELRPSEDTDLLPMPEEEHKGKKSISEMSLNDMQKKVAQLVLKGYNLFITGDAGTGKTYAMVEILGSKELEKKVIAYCALTGTAALNIKGVTLHRFLHLPTKPLIESTVRISEELKSVDILFIDEIGMARVDTFDYLARAVLKENERRERESEYGISNKQSIQLILSGDFFQLPPVITDNDREVLQMKYGVGLRNGFAFQSEYWDKLNLVSVYLYEIMRQKEAEFMNNINKIRYGCYDGISYFNYCCNPARIEGGITVCGTNKRAKECNYDELNKLDGKTYTSVAKIVGDVKETDKCAEDIFEYKVGARVMAVINNYQAGYLNGMLGTIEDATDKKIMVRFDDCSERVIEVERNVWEIKAYTAKENEKTHEVSLSEEVVGTFEQFPLKLGYAITIHKAQGKTFSKVNFEPYCWDNGQLYVGLSRAKTAGGLHVVGSIKNNFLKTSEDVKEFYRRTFPALRNI